jgi:hypothetical protein
MDQQIAVDRILETENLTASLEDSDANWLLDWGISHVPRLIGHIQDDEAAGTKVNELMAVMRKLNQIAGESAEKPAEELDKDIKELAALYSKAFGAIRMLGADDFKRAAGEIRQRSPLETMQFLIDFVARGSPAAWSVPGDPGREDSPLHI